MYTIYTAYIQMYCKGEIKMACLKMGSASIRASGMLRDWDLDCSRWIVDSWFFGWTRLIFLMRTEHLLKILRMFKALVIWYHGHFELPSGKLSHNYGKSPCSMGKSTMSITIFNSFLFVYRRVSVTMAAFSIRIATPRSGPRSAHAAAVVRLLSEGRRGLPTWWPGFGASNGAQNLGFLGWKTSPHF